jgi:uncharacterized protein YecE (DUF72 family)
MINERPDQEDGEQQLSDIYVGTAGYSYSHWRNGVFYPKHVTQAAELRHYSGVFNAVEINASFHGVPREETLRNWAEKAKPGFLFSFKVPQAITHEKRLEHIDSDLTFFLNRIRTCLLVVPTEKNSEDGKRVPPPSPPSLGPILFQLPPSLPKNVEKLDEIARLLPKQQQGIKVAFEFRNKSWYCEEVFDAMARHDFGLCENISPDNTTFHTTHVTSKTWHYIRFHKRGDRRVTNYSHQQLATIADQLVERRRHNNNNNNNKIVQYCYFLNDHEGNGPRNAKSLMKLIQERVKGPFVANWKPDPTESSIQSLFAKSSAAGGAKSSRRSNIITTDALPPSSPRSSVTPNNPAIPNYSATKIKSKRTSPSSSRIKSFFGPGVPLPPGKRHKTMATQVAKAVTKSSPAPKKTESIASFFSKKT